MSPFLCGKSTLTPDLPLLQRLPVFRLPSPGEMFLNNRLEITVLELSGADLVRLIQTFLPQRTAAAVFLFCPVFPEQPAAASIQPLAPQFFPVRAQVYVPLFVIGECIPLLYLQETLPYSLHHALYQAQPFRGRRSVRYPVSSEYRRFLFGNSSPYQCGPAEKKSIPPP